MASDSVVRGSRERWVERARELAARDGSTRSLLDAYERLLVLQRDCSASLDGHAATLSGSLERDVDAVAATAPRCLDEVATFGPPLLADSARELLDGGLAAIHAMLLAGWRTPSDEQFFSKLILQPYAHWLARHDRPPLDRDLPSADNRCPFCHGAPQVSILQHSAGNESGGRLLQCGTCFTTWPFRRIRCPHCSEEDERKLGYFHAPAYEHLRIDVCETCRRYVKTVDLTRLGLAVPIVDEVASAPLDLWARDRGYEKIALNLVGL